MSIACSESSGIRVSIHIAEPTGPQIPYQAYDDIAVASPDVWDQLLFDARNGLRPDASPETMGKVAVSLEFGKQTSRNIKMGSILKKPMIFWLAQTSQEPAATKEIILPSAYAREFNRLSDIECSAIFVKPIVLSEVILISLSENAFLIAQNHPEKIEEWLCRGSRLIRQGSTYTCRFLDGYVDDSQDGAMETSFSFEVAISEPVRQGVARAGVTRFLVTIKYSEPSSTIPMVDPTSPTEDDLIIDEFFLAGSTLIESKLARKSLQENDTLNHNGHQDVTLKTPTRFPKPLTDGVSVTTCRLIGPIDVAHDHSTTVYFRTSTLAQMGVFDGDWAIAEGSERRLIQVQSADDNIESQESSLASPTLRRNLVPNQPCEDAIISFRASPFGAGPPVIPTAKTATLARIASPASLDRNHQKSFLQALKRYFADSKRIVKKGDLISVGISTEPVYEIVNEDDTKEDSSAAVEHAEQSSSLDTLISFLVTNLEYDVIPHAEEKNLSDSYLQAAMGELGCWIDPTVTRMVQTGLEHCLVPDTEGFLGLDSPGLSYNAFPLTSCRSYTKLRDFVTAPLRENAAEYGLELAVLLKGAVGSGLTEIAKHVARSVGYHSFEINVYGIMSETESKTSSNLKEHFSTATSCAPCVFVLENIDAFSQSTQKSETNKEPSIVNVFRECIGDLSKAWKKTTFPTVVVGTSSRVEAIPTGILTCFKQEITCEVPDEREREKILKASLSRDTIGGDVSLKNLATQTAALTYDDILDLVARARHCSIGRTMQAIRGTDNTEFDAIHAGLLLTKSDFDSGLDKARASFSQSIGAPSIPNVSWDDVGGLASVKEDILDTIQLPLDHPELFADGLKQRSGILLYGPPGTGKTLLAKAVATSCSLNFFSVKGPELLNMYIGESEANVRRVFQRARDASPCVIFFDELDSVAPKRGNQGDSGGVMDRIVSQLLAELDGMSSAGSASSVFVIGATNRPDLLDPALLRPGRFDRLLYLGISDTHEAQLKILEALTRKFRLDPELDLSKIANLCPFNYTGADFYALCSDAMLKAMSRKAEEVDTKIAKLNASTPIVGHQYPITPQYYLSAMAEPEDTDVLVSSVDFEQALAELVPSVSQSELNHYKTVQQRFNNESSSKGKGKEKEKEM